MNKSNQLKLLGKVLNRRLSFIDKSSVVHDNSTVMRFSSIRNSTVGSFSYIAPRSIIRDTDVGNFCSIGSDCLVGGLGKHPTNRISTSPVFYSNKNPLGIFFTSRNQFQERVRTHIGNDVWIGTRVIILDGVTIGDGAIVAAGSVVTKDIPPYAIYGGTPAKMIRLRFSESTITRIHDIKWWEMPISKIEQLAALGLFDLEEEEQILQLIDQL